MTLPHGTHYAALATSGFILSSLQKFLIIDHNADGRFLLTKTLLRKFPRAIALECTDPGSAVLAAGSEKIDIIIAHNTGDVNGVELVQLLRRVNPDVPIFAVSGMDRSKQLAEAGANRFMNYDEWLMVANVVEEMINPTQDSEGAIPFLDGPARAAGQ